ncbi:MAG: alanine racemase, partial [Marinicella sp.]
MQRERGTKAYINTKHISHNLNVFKQLHPGKIIAVVKADAYGHGLERVVPTLSACDAFAVATMEEGIELRRLNSTKKIILLEGVFNAFEMQTAIDQKFDVVVHQDYQLDLLHEVKQQAVIDVWLKIDTGMNRLGFPVDEFLPKLKVIKENIATRQVRVMSHFASSDSPLCKQTQAQIALNQMIKACDLEYSFSNTGAVLNQLSENTEWARVGLGLFGVSPLNHPNWAAKYDLKPAMHLTAKIIASKFIAAGSQIGYGGHCIASQDMRIGIVGIGYADGYPWSEFSSKVWIEDKLVQVLGRVSMDMIAVDLSQFKDNMTGNEVTIWGPNLPVEAVAQDLKLIPYALICGITKRVKFYDI